MPEVVGSWFHAPHWSWKIPPMPHSRVRTDAWTCPKSLVVELIREVSLPTSYQRSPSVNLGSHWGHNSFHNQDVNDGILSKYEYKYIGYHSHQQWLLGFNIWIWEWCVVFLWNAKTGTELQRWKPGTFEHPVGLQHCFIPDASVQSWYYHVLSLSISPGLQPSLKTSF